MSELIELRNEFEELKETYLKLHTDMISLIWLSGECDYCKFHKTVKYGNATKIVCRLEGDCRPEWRG